MHRETKKLMKPDKWRQRMGPRVRERGAEKIKSGSIR